MITNVEYERVDKARRALLEALLECQFGEESVQDMHDRLGPQGIDKLKIADYTRDSLEILNIIVDIEDDLNVELDDAEMQKFMLEEATVGTVLPVITKALEG